MLVRQAFALEPGGEHIGAGVKTISGAGRLVLATKLFWRSAMPVASRWRSKSAPCFNRARFQSGDLPVL